MLLSRSLARAISSGRRCGKEAAILVFHLLYSEMVGEHSTKRAALTAVKALHTAVWAFFVGCIVAIPFAGARGQYVRATVLSALVLLECAVLAMNGGRCPLTDLAGRYTDERADNFDIYLPLWLARNNKIIFGTLFAFAEIFVLARWIFPS
jgi:hypothetical protein